MKCNQELKVLWDGRLKVYLAKVIIFFFLLLKHPFFCWLPLKKVAHFSMSLFFPGEKKTKINCCSIVIMRLRVNLLLTCLILAHAQSVGRSELTGKTSHNWDLSLILVGRMRKQKNNVFIPACTSDRAYRSLEGPSSSCRSGWPQSRAYSSLPRST